MMKKNFCMSLMLLVALGFLFSVNTVDARTYNRVLYGESGGESVVARTRANLPATTTAALFEVQGGLVEVTQIVGVVTTAIQTQACALSLQWNPNTGSNVTLNDGGGDDITGDTAGTIYTLNTSLATALQVGAGGADEGMTYSLVLAPGVIQWNTDATNSGAVAWYIRYKPLTPGARVIAR
jgi:hypothetical protein